MNAVILSGGDNARLWPLAGPAAALPILERPLLTWTAQRLKTAGVDRLFLTLPAQAELPGPDRLCLPVTVCREEVPPASAGALLPLAAELEHDDFFLIQGGLLWDFDLPALLEDHRRHDVPATLALCRSTGLQSCNAVVTDRKGRVRRFEDDPPAERRSFTAFTGAAVCSPDIFRWLDGVRSLSRELFPKLVRAGRLRGVTVQGWQRAIRSPEDFLQTTADVLGGKCRDLWTMEPLQTGVWSASPIPDDVEIVPPCFIGAGASLGKGCLIGPHVCLEDGVTIGERSLVQRSVLRQNTAVGSRATIYGVVADRDARLGCCTVLNEGCAVGAGAVVGDSAILMEGVRVGPGLSVPPSLRLTADLTAPVVLSLQPPPAPSLTVEDMTALGRRLGRTGLVGAGGEGFHGLLLARAFGCGAAAAGADVIFHDGTLPEQAAWLADYYGWPASVFAAENGDVYLFDHQGRALTAPPPDGETGPGSWDTLAGTAAAYRAALERTGKLPEACAAFRSKKGLYFL